MTVLFLMLLARINQHFDGKRSDDEILYRAEITRKQLREVLHHYTEYVSCKSFAFFELLGAHSASLVTDISASIIDLSKYSVKYMLLLYVGKGVCSVIFQKGERNRMIVYARRGPGKGGVKRTIDVAQG